MTEETSLGFVRETPQTAAERFWSAAFVGEDDRDGLVLLPDRLSGACVRVLPIAAAGLSLMSSSFRVPLGASGVTASFAERLQFTLGQGPCLEAYAQDEPFRVTGGELQRRWPALHGELVGNTPYRSVVSLPLLRVTPGRGGAVDLYLEDPDQAATFDVAEALAVTDSVAIALGLGDGPAEPAESPAPGWLDTPSARDRSRVWTAIGMVNVELEIDAADALSVLRAHAYAQGRTVDDLAADLVDGTLSVDRLPQ